MTNALHDAIAAMTRQVIEDHDDWDSLWTGEKLRAGTFAVIDTAYAPAAYPAIVQRIAGEQQAKHPDNPAIAYLLQAEAFTVDGPGPDAGDEEHRRPYRERPEAREVADAIAADIHGRIWTASHTRSDEANISESYHPSRETAGGRFALREAALTQGRLAWGIIGR